MAVTRAMRGVLPRPRRPAARAASALRACAATLVAAFALAAAPPQAHAAEPAGRPRDVWLEAGFERTEGYVQAQALYTLRLYQAIDVRELRFDVPAPALGELRPLGDDRLDEAVRDGRRYRVTERRFAVFPYASGDFALPGVRVTGLVAVRGAAPGTREPLRLDAPAATLAVLPIPDAAATGPWLPARALTLTEEWTPAARELRTGDVLHRTIRIEARGLDAAQLPAPELAADGFSVHAGPARLDSRVDGDWIVGMREQTWRFVPSRGGELVVPPVELSWRDAATGEARIAMLPARTFAVAGGPQAAAAAAPSAVEDGAAPDPVTPPAATAAPPPADRGPPMALGAAAVVALLAAVATIAACRRDPARRDLHRACRANDPRAARDALLEAAARRLAAPAPRSLGELAARLDDPACRTALAALDRALYGPAGSWQGAALLACVPILMKRGRPRTRVEAALPPLYPSFPSASALSPAPRSTRRRRGGNRAASPSAS